jgi:methyltransferase (TIGR00027 family)
MALGEQRRNPLRPRSTAEGAAALRAAGALERDPAVRCPDDLAAGFLGGFNVTTLAKRRLTRLPLLWRANRALPGAYPYEIARCKFIDDVMSSELDVGLDELVLLGAGLDSRPYRFADRLGGLRVFEVDHPASQATKRARLHRLFGEEPRSVRFVPVDFNRDDLVTEMARAGHDERAATLFIWSGVSPYLSEAAVTAVLTWVGNHTSPRTSIIFDAVWASAVHGDSDRYGARELKRAVESVAEPLRWGIPDERIGETLECYGLRAARIVEDDQAATTYLTRLDGGVLGRPYGFGVLLHARSRARGGAPSGHEDGGD